MPAREIQVEFRRGVYLPEIDFWLDPAEGKESAFVSHAHADHVAPHGESICSSVTKTLVEKRFSGRGSLVGYDFGEWFQIRGYRAKLLPAGHILGSAQIYIENESGASILYTGDFKLRHGAASSPAEAIKADTLIMETTYGLPKYQMPPSDEVLSDMVRFVREALEDDQVPVLGAYSLGKAQEVLIAIGQRAPELKFLLHNSAARMTEIYAELGYEVPDWSVLEKDSEIEGKVILVPPSTMRSQQIRKIKNRVTTMISGWGLDPGAKFRYQVDEVFPLSDHADYNDLVRYVERVHPNRVLTLHGFAREFAADLRERGWEAWALTGENQLELRLGARQRSTPTSDGEQSSITESEFGHFSEICDRVSKSTGKLKKVAILADYLKELESEQLGIAATFLTGRAFGRTDQTRTLNVGWAIMRRAVLEASERTEAEYRALSQGQNEAGRAAYLALKGRTTPEEFSLTDIRDCFQQLADARGPAPKTAILKEQLRRLHPSEAQYLIKILSGDLRIGLKEGLVEEAIAKAFDAPAVKVRKVHMLLGNLGQTAQAAAREELDEATITPFVPIMCMLASPEETAGDIWNRLGGENGVWLEDKFDGIRAQLHRVGDRVELFSRDLRSLSREFPELVDSAIDLGADYILDGEIIAYAEGKRLTFFDLQKRLGRRNESDLFFGPSVPVRFVAFDLLWHDGESLLEAPLRDRRQALERMEWKDPIEVLSIQTAQSKGEIEAAFKAARLRENEGLIAKDPESVYSPGRRGLSWLKLKKPMSTLDVVVVKAEEGHGKRSHVLSDYTFAIQDERSGELVVIGKAYSGLTDVEIEELTEHFKEHTISKGRRSHTVTPNVVLEIAFDSIQPSKRHNSGLALRFPRIKAIRRDKIVEEIDSLQYARSLVGLESVNSEQ